MRNKAALGFLAILGTIIWLSFVFQYHPDEHQVSEYHRLAPLASELRATAKRDTVVSVWHMCEQFQVVNTTEDELIIFTVAFDDMPGRDSSRMLVTAGITELSKEMKIWGEHYRSDNHRLGTLEGLRAVLSDSEGKRISQNESLVTIIQDGDEITDGPGDFGIQPGDDGPPFAMMLVFDGLPPLPASDKEWKPVVQLRNADVKVDIPLCMNREPMHRASICTKPLFNAPKNPQALWEWVAYHRILGIEHFYVYDMDGLHERDVERINEQWPGLVTHRLYRKFNDQLEVSDHPLADGENHHYQDQAVFASHCIMQGRSSNDWLFILDTDEYLHFGKTTQQSFHNNIADYLEGSTLGNAAAGVIKSMWFERSDNTSPLTVQQFQGSAGFIEDWFQRKYFVQPKKVALPGIHCIRELFEGEVVYVDPEEVRINHLSRFPEWYPVATPVLDDGMNWVVPRLQEMLAERLKLNSTVP